MKYAYRILTWALLICFLSLQMLNQNVMAVDETIPHPIDERGLLSWVAVKTTRLFRTVDVIEIIDFTIQKPEVSIEPGTVIVIENQDKTNHRMTFPQAPGNDITIDVSSSVIKPGELWGAEFLDIGTYPYHCTLHPNQEKEKGVIKVVQKQASEH